MIHPPQPLRFPAARVNEDQHRPEPQLSAISARVYGWPAYERFHKLLVPEAWYGPFGGGRPGNCCAALRPQDSLLPGRVAAAASTPGQPASSMAEGGPAVPTRCLRRLLREAHSAGATRLAVLDIHTAWDPALCEPILNADDSPKASSGPAWYGRATRSRATTVESPTGKVSGQKVSG